MVHITEIYRTFYIFKTTSKLINFCGPKIFCNDFVESLEIKGKNEIYSSSNFQTNKFLFGPKVFFHDFVESLEIKGKIRFIQVQSSKLINFYLAQKYFPMIIWNPLKQREKMRFIQVQSYQEKKL